MDVNEDRVATVDDHVMVTPEVLLSRQAELVPARVTSISIAIVGMGGIGSNVFDIATRMGVTEFTLYDGDNVEAANVWPGAFAMEDVGQPKAEVMVRRMETTLGANLHANIRGWFDVDDAHQPHDIWVVGTDTMRSRRDVWEVVSNLRLFGLYIDSRMGGGGFEIYTITADDRDAARQYEQHHLANVADQDLPCGQKATAPITKEIASQVVGRVRAYLTGTLEHVPGTLMIDWDTGVRGVS